ncbi:MAG: KaiC domain-containing protein, partial [Thermoproteota archaeon]
MAVIEAVETAAQAYERAPRLFGVPTGVRGLDELFFTVELEGGRPVKRTLGGIPYRSVLNVTGVPDTGKSLMAEQFAVKQASLGYPTCFVTVETPANFVAAGLRRRAEAMGVDWDSVRGRILLVDAASYRELREELPSLLKTLAHVIREYDVKNVVIDSITGLFEAREVMARSLVREVYNFLKRWGQTAILISQKRSAHGAE